MRQVEAIRCWPDGTWDIEFVQVEDFDDETLKGIESYKPLDKLTEEAVQRELGDASEWPIHVGVYHVPPEDEQEILSADDPEMQLGND